MTQVRAPWRKAGMLATGHSSTGYLLISASVLERSRSTSAHASSNPTAVSGGTASAKPRNSLKMGQLLAPAANLRLIKHGPTLHKELPPKLAQQLQRARPERLHTKALTAQRVGRRVHGRAGLRRNWDQAIILEKPNRVSAQLIQVGLTQRNRRANRIVRVLAAEHAKDQRHVTQVARHRAKGAESEERPNAGRRVAAARNAARSGLERADAREMRRHAPRAAAVAA